MTPEHRERMHADLVRHEAGHACAALLLGLPVGGVYAPPLPDVWDDPDQSAGRTEVGLRKGDRRAQAITLLAGPMCEGWPAPAWPIEPQPHSDDERRLLELVGEGDELSYLELVRDAKRLVESDTFVRFHATTSELLSHMHALDEQQLQGIKSVTATTKRATPTYGRTVLPVKIKSLDRDPWRSKALDGLGVLPQDVVNAADWCLVADPAVASAGVVVLEPVWQRGPTVV